MSSRGVALTIVAACTLGAASATAHVIPDPTVLVVVPKPGSVEIRVNDMGQPGPDSIETRRRYDGNRDGTLDDSERSDLENFLVARARTNLKVWQDGKPLALEEKTRAMHGLDHGIEGGDPLSIDLVLEAPVVAKGGRVEITVGDWRPDGHAVRAVVLPQGGAKIAKTSLGELEADSGVVTGVSLDHEQALTLSWTTR